MASRSVIEVVLRGTDQSMSSTMRSAETESKGLVGALGDLKVGYLAVAGATVGVIAGINSVVSSVVTSARELQAFSTRLGVSAGALSEIKFAAEQNNIAFGQVAIGMQRMTRRVAEAAQGMGEAQGAIKELGLDAEALGQMLPDQQLEAVASRLGQVTNQSDKVRLAFKLFDSEGVGLLQLFDDMGGSLGELRQRARDLGVAMSDDMVKQLDAAARAGGEFKAAIDGIGQAITAAATENVEALRALTEFVTKLAPIAGTVTRIVIEGLSAGVSLKPFKDFILDVGILAMHLKTGIDYRALEETAKAAKEAADEAERLKEELEAVHEELGTVAKAGESEIDVALKIGADFAVEDWNVDVADLSDVQKQLDGIAKRLEEEHNAALDRRFGTPTKIEVPAPTITFDGPPVPDKLVDLGESLDTWASQFPTELEEISKWFLELGYSVEWVEENIRNLSSIDLQLATQVYDVDNAVQQLGVSGINSAAMLADSFAGAMASSIAGVQSFSDAASQAFRAFVRSAIADLSRLVAKILILRVLKTFANPASVFTPTGGDVVTMSGGGYVPTPVPGGGGGYVAGMVIPGFGGGDRVPALLEGGELVLNKVATRNLGLSGGAGAAFNMAASDPSAVMMAPPTTRTQNIQITVNAGFGSRAEGLRAADAVAGYLQEAGYR